MQLDDFQCERDEVKEEARVEADDSAGLPFTAELNTGNLVQLLGCPLHFFKPEDKTC